jgi:hypothetical protein
MNPYDIEYWRRVDQCRVSQTYLKHTLNGGFKDLRREMCVWSWSRKPEEDKRGPEYGMHDDINFLH